MNEVKLKSEGTTPEGTHDQQSAARAVQQMFDEIAPRYDLLNHVLSANIDRVWWWRSARTFDHILRQPDARVLDLCCGTGDMTLALHARRPQQSEAIIAADFAHQMLSRGAQKFRARNANARSVEADALHMPFTSGSFDLIVSAFGFRNLADYQAGLEEIARVLRSGGEVGILDFSEPKGMLGRLYRFYFKHVLPRIGAMLSRHRAAYLYLPSSVEKFPEPPEMIERMRRAGFINATWTPYSFGIAGLYRATKA